MNKTNEHIDDLVNTTLKAFDGAERAKPKPFLYTRLQARMDKHQGAKMTMGVFSPFFQKVMLGFIVFVFAFNIYTTSRLFLIPAEADSIKLEEIVFIDEFYPSTPTLYSINQTTRNP